MCVCVLHGTFQQTYSKEEVRGCVYLAEECVLVMPDGNVLVLGSVGDDLNQATDLGLGIQGHAEQLCGRKKHVSMFSQQTSSRWGRGH